MENLENKETETKEEENKEKEKKEGEETATGTSTVYDEAYIAQLTAKMEEEKVKAVEDAKKEMTDKAAEEAKLSGMSEEEKAAYEASKKEQSLADREAALALRELRADTKSLLAEQGLPVDVMESVIGKDLETTKQNIANFKKHVDAEVNKQVTARLTGKTPERGTGAGNEDVTEAAKEFAAFL